MSVRSRTAPALVAALGLVVLWVGAAWVWEDGEYRLNALVLALAALPASLAVVLAATLRGISWGATVALVWVLVVTAWASGSGLVPQVWPWDSVEHLCLALAWCRWVGEVLRRLDREAGYWTIAVAALGVAAVCGVLWEVVEFSADALLGTDMSPSDGDTIKDLCVDLLGAALGAAWLARSLGPRRQAGA